MNDCTSMRIEEMEHAFGGAFGLCAGPPSGSTQRHRTLSA